MRTRSRPLVHRHINRPPLTVRRPMGTISSAPIFCRTNDYQRKMTVDDIVRYRRHFHAHPELSMEEHETAAFIERELRGFGYDAIRSGVGKTGVLATLQGGRPGPVTLLRADMDALPIAELNEVPYRSRAEGVMHACGHDGHVAI
ncbi:MAG: M20/M25/M40 family metallo-hydrolase, partial [Candidatus Eremiobacteraeota bacterium]|nr:M20/M25/M40 family metallo-hydrolase [Candidatus Eremiobacteraeota bacterium]